jgi:hypothetical protein
MALHKEPIDNVTPEGPLQSTVGGSDPKVGTSGSGAIVSWPVVVICVVGTGLRIAAGRGELWLDEVWSLQIVQQFAHSIADILLKLKLDNNHFVNSFVAFELGPDCPDWMYRAPAVLAGILSLLLAGWAQRRKGTATVTAAVILAGFSYLFVQYSSEARGYSYEIFCSIFAFGP